MARVFTITPGLENMGALKTGGQGSVYKGRRIGEIITAIKILPTPVYTGSADDKNFISFQNEVDKLKKVNEQPNPNIVKILSSGLTETGNFPFIEMEFIEGPDLEELLKPPHEPVFTIKETLKVAEQLSYALSHCHKFSVKHGDIKSNNIKFNTKTANYVLLDFGLAIMSDEQRRTSLRHAGAIEFMAPEQNTGQMMFQTDIYSFGIILFELLAGTVPFPLKDRGESARNEVRLAHMVTQLPDFVELRKQLLPSTWNDQKKEHEMHLPDWIINLVYKCLEKKPESRFSNGSDLYKYISENYTGSYNAKVTAGYTETTSHANQQLSEDSQQLQKQIVQYQLELKRTEDQIFTIKTALNSEENQLENQFVKNGKRDTKKIPRISQILFFALLFISLVFAAIIGFSLFKAKPVKSNIVSNTSKKTMDTTLVKVASLKNKKSTKKSKKSNIRVNKGHESTINFFKDQLKKVFKNLQKNSKAEIGKEKPAEKNNQVTGKKDEDQNPLIEPVRKPDNNATTTRIPDNQIKENTQNDARPNTKVVKRYLVVAKAYFYDTPDEAAQRNEFISQWENAVVNAIDERYGFIYVIIKTPQEQTFKGWLRKKDLKLYSIE